MNKFVTQYCDLSIHDANVRLDILLSCQSDEKRDRHAPVALHLIPEHPTATCSDNRRVLASAEVVYLNMAEAVHVTGAVNIHLQSTRDGCQT